MQPAFPIDRRSIVERRWNGPIPEGAMAWADAHSRPQTDRPFGALARAAQRALARQRAAAPTPPDDATVRAAARRLAHWRGLAVAALYG